VLAGAVIVASSPIRRDLIPALGDHPGRHVVAPAFDSVVRLPVWTRAASGTYVCRPQRAFNRWIRRRRNDMQVDVTVGFSGVM